MEQQIGRLRAGHVAQGGAVQQGAHRKLTHATARCGVLELVNPNRRLRQFVGYGKAAQSVQSEHFGPQVAVGQAGTARNGIQKQINGARNVAT
jgi:hypothetical protein